MVRKLAFGAAAPHQHAMRLLLTQDPCRDPTFGMTANPFLYQWLDGLLRTTFERAGWAVDLVAPRAAGGHFDAGAIAAALGLDRSPQGWAALSGDIDTARLDDALDAQILAPGAGGAAADLLVGFELPPWLMGWATRRGIPAVCIAPSACRFLPTLPVEMHTTLPALHRAATALAIGEDELERAAALFAAARRARHGLPLMTQGRVGLLVGQMAIDAATIAGGRLTRIDEHIETLAEIARGFDWLLVRPHPYETDIAPLRAVCAAIGHARLTRLPTYDLLCAPPVGDVVALSSSVLAEARLFGRQAHGLLHNDRSRCRAALGLEPVVLGLDDLAGLLGALARSGDLSSAAPDRAGTGRATLAAPGLREGLGLDWGLEEQGLPAQLSPGSRIDAAHRPEARIVLPPASRPAGWWEPDTALLWTRDPVADLLLRVHDGVGRWLGMEVHAPAHAAAPVEVSLCAGSAHASCRLPPGGSTRLGLTVSDDMLIGGTLLDLRVLAGHRTAPAPGSADPRTLGVGLAHITLA